MKVLIIEDDENFSRPIVEVLVQCTGAPSVILAKSRESAETRVRNDFFDLIVLDLKIPSQDGLLDADPQHGRATFYVARSLAPGTPLYVLTGSSAEAFIGDFLGGSQKVDVWNEGEAIPTVQFLRKIDFALFPKAAEAMCKAVWNLSEVELETPNGPKLEIAFDRLLRIFARKYGGVRCTVEHVGGGYSGAQVLRLMLTAHDGSLIHNAIAKLGTLSDIRLEGNLFDEYVCRLGPSATPRKLCILEHGAKSFAGVFYQLADGFDFDAFAAVERDATLAATIPDRLAKLFQPWQAKVPQSKHSIAEIRRTLLADVQLKPILAKHPILWISEFENRQIQVRWCCTHRDLHGKNVLVADDGSSVVIDYGDVGKSTASIDPVTYELSLLFHPQGPLKKSGWPTTEQAGHWGDLDKYLVNCPVPYVIRAIRDWTEAVAIGRREIAASAYSYLIRQLKYEDNNPNLILALLDGVYQYFLST